MNALAAYKASAPGRTVFPKLVLIKKNNCMLVKPYRQGRT
jgi:hypothetical protein